MSPSHGPGDFVTPQRRHTSVHQARSQAERSPDLLGDALNGLSDVTHEVGEVAGETLKGVTDALNKLQDGVSSLIAPPAPSSTEAPPASGSASPPPPTTTQPSHDIGDLVDGLLGGVVGALGGVVDGLSSALTPTQTAGPLDKVLDPVESLVGKVVGVVGNLVDGVKDGLTATPTVTLPIISLPTIPISIPHAPTTVSSPHITTSAPSVPTTPASDPATSKGGNGSSESQSDNGGGTSKGGDDNNTSKSSNGGGDGSSKTTSPGNGDGGATRTSDLGSSPSSTPGSGHSSSGGNGNGGGETSSPSHSQSQSQSHIGSDPQTTESLAHSGTSLTHGGTAGTGTGGTATPTITNSASGSLASSLAEIINAESTGTLDHNPQNGARVTQTPSASGTGYETDSRGRTIYHSGTYSSYVGSPTGGINGGGSGGGSGGGANHGLIGGLSIGALAGIITLVILFLLACLVVFLRRYQARRRANRLQGWFAGWRRDGEDRGIEGRPQMSQSQRRLSDDSFATPEHTLNRNRSITSTVPSSPLPSEDHFSVNDLISISSSYSAHSLPPAHMNPPVIPLARHLPASQNPYQATTEAAVPSADQPQLSTAPTAFPRKPLRTSQLTIRAVPFNSAGRTVTTGSRESLQSVAPENPFADRRESTQSQASEWTARSASIDLMAFPRPPSRNTLTQINARSILATKATARDSLQSLAETITPARSDFDYARNRFTAQSSGPQGASLGVERSGSQDEDPFADNLNVRLPSPMASSAAQSLFFPGDGTSPSNMTRIARSWAPNDAEGSPEELAVNAGDEVRVISRHAVMPNASSEQLSRQSTLGGWALVKRMDAETGISKRGFVPVNCLMDVEGPPSPLI